MPGLLCKGSQGFKPPALAARAVMAAPMFASAARVGAQTSENSPPPAKALHNSDILLMVRVKVAPETIIQKILRSPCEFDTFPPLMSR